MQAFLAAKTEQNWMVNKHLEQAKNNDYDIIGIRYTYVFNSPEWLIIWQRFPLPRSVSRANKLRDKDILRLSD